MSAGPFRLGKYERDNGTDIHPISLQTETYGAEFGGTANAEPTADANSDFRVKVSRSANGYGLLPRKINIRFTGNPPSGYKADQTYAIPVLTLALWQAVSVGDVGTYLGVATQVVSKSPENAR